MGMKSTPLSFSPALPCVDCAEPTTLGLISPVSSQMWQLVPLCNEHSEQPEPASAEEAFAHIGSLQQLVTRRIQAIEQLQRRRQHLAHAYLRLRKQHAPHKAQRALRIGLNRASRRQAEMREEALL